MRLSLPGISPTPDPAVETRAVYVEEWVETLPYANPPILLEQTEAALVRLNEQPLKPALRLELLELHIRPYAFALDFRRTQDPPRTSAVLARQRAMSRRLQTCAVQMALGYKQALTEFEARRSLLRSGREMRTALQRAALFSSLALLCGYDEYRPSLPLLWLESIAIYEAAYRDRHDGVPVSSPVEDPVFSQSVADCFKRLCLTSLVDPYQLASGELWSVYEAFAEIVPLISIAPVAPVQSLGGIFVVDPKQDHRPVPIARLAGAPDARCWLIDTNPALDVLRRRFAGSRTTLASHVLAAMIRGLGLPPRRHAPRASGEGRVQLAVGLSTVHHFLTGAVAEPLPRETPGDDIEIHDVTGLAGETAASYGHERWQLADEGHGGVGIVRRSQPLNPVGVGELVGLQFPLRGDLETDWSVGVVRWIAIHSEEHHQAGIQLLAESGVPVLVHSESVGDTITRIPRPAVALPDIGPEAGNTLIAPRGMFARGNMIKVKGERRDWLVQAQDLSESTAAFDRFTYRIVDPS